MKLQRIPSGAVMTQNLFPESSDRKGAVEGQPDKLLLRSIVMRKESPSRLIACHVPGSRFFGNGITASLVTVADAESDTAALS